MSDEPLRVVAAAWRRGRRFLACRRSETAARGGHWELPGGKVEHGESDQGALRRELEEELAVRPEVGALLAENVHRYPEVRIRLVVYWCSGSMEPTPLEHAELRWVDAREAVLLDWAPADRPLVELVRQHLSGDAG